MGAHKALEMGSEYPGSTAPNLEVLTSAVFPGCPWCLPGEEGSLLRSAEVPTWAPTSSAQRLEAIQLSPLLSRVETVTFPCGSGPVMSY